MYFYTAVVIVRITCPTRTGILVFYHFVTDFSNRNLTFLSVVCRQMYEHFSEISPGIINAHKLNASDTPNTIVRITPSVEYTRKVHSRFRLRFVANLNHGYRNNRYHVSAYHDNNYCYRILYVITWKSLVKNANEKRAGPCKNSKYRKLFLFVIHPSIEHKKILI